MKLYSSREEMFAAKQQSSNTKSNQQPVSQLPKLEIKSSMLGEAKPPKQSR